MNRCIQPFSGTRRRTLLLALGLTGAMLAPIAQAQNQPRLFPAKALRGTLVVKQPPLVLLDGQPAQLAPGARIKGTNNMLLLSGALVEQKLTVNYTLETHGLVHEVWILTEAEAAEKRKRAGE